MLREKHSICYTSTGSHAFVGGKDDKGELEAYGVGISLYFKYLKYLKYLARPEIASHTSQRTSRMMLS